MSERFVVATNQGGLEDQVSSVFGRAPTFTVVEVNGDDLTAISVLSNPYKDAPSGAGIQAAQFVAEQGPRVAMAGNFGPNVSAVLAQAGVEMVPVSGSAVREAVEAYKKGALSPLSGPAVTSAGQGMAQGMSPGAGPRMGRGMGMGRGRGMGIGQPAWGMGGAPMGPTGQGQTDDPATVRQRLSRLESELEEIKEMLSKLKGGE